MTVRILSSVRVDVGEFPLRLPIPTPENSGGYLTPIGYTYSDIDLLVAGLEAVELKKDVTNLAQFFDSHRNMISMSKVKLTFSIDNEIYHESILCIKNRILATKNENLLTVMQKNAPLTFKWGMYGISAKV